METGQDGVLEFDFHTGGGGGILRPVAGGQGGQGGQNGENGRNGKA